ncbi:MAG TPA: double zinc ribbon domain-containing protein [Blastocatellia bacterium]|nr:double zinc ribbon domain-containing protein [Blastocatellia bacterium]
MRTRGGPGMFGRALRTLRDGLLSLAYPASCRLCGEPVAGWDDGVVCGNCWRDPELTRLFAAFLLCAKCGVPLPGLADDKRTCNDCDALPISSARACGAYMGALQANILFLKPHPHICPRLRRLIHNTFSAHRDALASEVTIPVPLHPSRRRERGFNQAALIARVIARGFGLRLDEHTLIRVKHTERHRAGMDAVDRARSVERAFRVVRPKLVKNTAVLLVDDVYTTGSTISAAAAELLAAGASRVNVLTIARVTSAANLPPISLTE